MKLRLSLLFLAIGSHSMILDAQQVKRKNLSKMDTSYLNDNLKEAESTFNAKKFDQCLDLTNKIIDTLQHYPGQDSLILASALQFKAMAKFRKNLLKDALESSRQSAEIRIAILGPKHIDLARNYNTMGNAYHELNYQDSAIASYQRALSIRILNLGENHKDVAMNYNNMAMAYGRKGDFDQALDFHKKALELRLKLFGANHVDVLQSYYNMGLTYRIKRNITEAIYWYKKGEDLARKLEDKSRLANILSELGVCAYLVYYYEDAISYANQALSILSELKLDKNPKIPDCYATIGNSYIESGYVQEGLVYLSKTEYSYQSISPENERQFAILYTQKAHAYNILNQFDNGLKYYLKSLNLFLKNNPKDPEIRSAYHGLAESYLYTNQIALAEDAIRNAQQQTSFVFSNNTSFRIEDLDKWSLLYKHTGDLLKEKAILDQKLKLTTAFLGEKDIETSKIEGALSDYFIRKNSLDSAMYFSEEQFFTLRNNVNFSNSFIPAYNLLPSVINRLNILDHFDPAILTDKYKKESNDFITEGLKTMEDFESPILQDESFIINRQKYFRFFDFAISLKIKQGDYKAAFHLSEKAKSSILISGYQRNQLRQLITLPDSIADQESKLKADINRFLKIIYANHSTPDSIHIAEWETELSEKQSKLTALVKDIETSHPKYFELNYKTNEINIEQIQNQVLDNQTAVIEYYLAEDKIYAFILTKSKLTCVSKSRPEQLNPLILELKNSITNGEYRVTGQDLNLFMNASDSLFNILLLEQSNWLSKSISRLILVPDGILASIPFELLGEKKTNSNFIYYSYLLNKYAISYAPNLKLLLPTIKNSTPIEQTKKKLFAGFAPDYAIQDSASTGQVSVRNVLINEKRYQLPGAIQEVKEIAALLGGRSYLAKDATENNFKKDAPHYSILHFAMHSILEQENPLFSKLLFTYIPNDTLEDSELNASEIYNLNLNSDLVVLSACNTGVGTVLPGEGIQSLSRAFTYAGVSSTVLSHWQVPDDATRKIMLSFYKNIMQDLPTDIALQKAKLRFLKSANTSIAANPFYWAGFVLNGKRDLKIKR